jgi:hypothetical protein
VVPEKTKLSTPVDNFCRQTPVFCVKISSGSGAGDYFCRRQFFFGFSVLKLISAASAERRILGRFVANST